MLQFPYHLTPRELGVASISLDRARKIASNIGPDALLWLAAVLRRHRSFSAEGRLAALLAAIRPIRAVVYIGQVAKPLHLSHREVREAVRALEVNGFIVTAPTIRTEAVEITLLSQNAAPAPQSGPLAGSSANQPPEG